MIFSLDFPFSFHQAWMRTRKGLFRTAIYNAYIAKAFIDLKAQDVVLKAVPYSLELYLHHSHWLTKPVNKKDLGHIAKKDVDNYVKVIVDTVVKYCEKENMPFDDCYIVSLSVHKKQDVTQQRAVLRFTPVEFC